jgi:multiple sugar transport system ATP-binding protein
MRDGVVQQIGTPDAIYERPRNMFVASFLGNPAINFLEGSVDASGNGAPLFRRGELTLRLPQSQGQRAAQPGQAVVLGIRAEDVEPGAGTASVDALTGRILSVLPVGSDQFLELEVEGGKLFFRVGKEGQYRVGDNATLKVNPNRLHLFDKEQGLSLLERG